MPFGKLQAGCHVPFTEEWLPSGHSNLKGLIGRVLQRWLSFWKELPSPQRNSGALSEWPLDSWSPLWPRPFSPDCSSLAGLPALRSLGGSKLLPFKNDWGHCVLGDLQCCRCFLVPFPGSVPRHNPVSEINGQFLRLYGLILYILEQGYNIIKCETSEAVWKRSKCTIQCLAKVSVPLELCDLLPHFRLQT